MARLLLSKSQLLAERRRLQAFRRFLPSLQMKRQQLMAAVSDSRQRLQRSEIRLQEIHDFVTREMPMVGNDSIDLRHIIHERQVEFRSVNIAGVIIQRVKQVHIERPPATLLTRPHWLIDVQNALQNALTETRHQQAEQHALAHLNHELTRVTQRLNLFEKVLIPAAQNTIRKIQIFLDDKAREAVVTSKIAKKKRAGVHQ